MSGGEVIKSHKAQISSEYVVLLALSIIIFLAIFVLISGQLGIARETKAFDEAKKSINDLANAAREVYYQGKGARQEVFILFPDGVAVGSPQITDSSITLRFDGSDISELLEFPIYGSLPQEPGAYYIEVISEGNIVRIGPVSFSVSPSSLSFEFCGYNTTQSNSKTLTFTNNENYSMVIDLSTSWTHSPDVNLSLSTNSINLSAGGSENVQVTVTLGAGEIGTWSGSITANSTNKSVTVPVTVSSSTCEVCPPGVGVCVNVSYLKILTYANASYDRLKEAFSLPPNIYITTGNWEPNATVTIDLRDPSNTSVSGYPKNVSVNSSGEYQEIWNDTAVYGTYYVYIYNTTNSTSTSFEVGCFES